MGELVDLGSINPKLSRLERPAAAAPFGLCRAIGARLGIDPLIFRILFVVLSFAGGLGVVLYAWGLFLTPRVGTQPQLLRLWPSFANYPKRTQLLIIAISTIALVMIVPPSGGAIWGIAIVAVIIALGRRSGTKSPPTPAAPGSPPTAAPGTAPTAAPGTAAAVDQWRSRIAEAAGVQDQALPTVDLYGPEPVLARTPRPKRKVSWGAVVTITLLTAVAAWIPVMIGYNPVVIWSLAYATVTFGICCILHALFRRRYRLPALFVAPILLVGGVANVGLATLANERPADGYETTVGEDFVHHEYTFVGEQATIDLRELDLPEDEEATIFITATASNVTVISDRPIFFYNVDEGIEVVETNQLQDMDEEVPDLTIEIVGFASRVEVEYVE